jgi:hypothetical protein
MNTDFVCHAGDHGKKTFCEAVTNAPLMTTILKFISQEEHCSNPFLSSLPLKERIALQQDIAWILSNIGANQKCARVLAEHGAIPLLFHALELGDSQLNDWCLWALGNLGLCDHKYRDDMMTSPLPQAITNILLRNTDYRLMQTCVRLLVILIHGLPKPSCTSLRLVLCTLSQLLYCENTAVLK